MVVDPRQTPLARLADLHLPVRPGTDLPVALALIDDLFERGHADQAFLDAHATGADELRERGAPSGPSSARPTVAGDRRRPRSRALADLYATTVARASSAAGGGSSATATAATPSSAVLALPAVAGKFGVRGGGYTLSNSAAYGLQQKPWLRRRRSRRRASST